MDNTYIVPNICSDPSHYPWGTGNCFFNLKKPVGMRLGNMSARARERLLRSNFDKLPLEWRVNQEGFIFPQEYVNVKEVEDLFRTPKRMSYFQDSSSKARKRLESDEHLPAFRDQVILAAMPDLYQNLFGKKSFITLTPNEQTECMRQVRFRFSADVNQIARVCGLSYAEAAQKMEGI